MRHHDLGFNIRDLLVIEGPRILTGKTVESYMNSLESFRNEVSALPGVKGITASSTVPGTEIKNSRVYGIPVEGRNTEKRIDLYYIDNRFFQTYGLTIMAGENFGPTLTEETNKVILNESALAYFGFENPEKSVGKNLRGGKQMVTIKAVIKDFNQQSLKELPRPIAFFNQPANVYYTIRLSSMNISQSLPGLEKIWNEHYPGNPFNYFFLEDYYNEQYSSDRRFSGLFMISSILAIIIACLGLYGLSSYSILKRTKEIGIRKTNGARIFQVMILLNVDFVKWVIIAIIIATPVAWIVMNKWLENFAYRISMNWWIIASSALIATAIALITVSWQSYRAATRNPVETLRYE
jgi:putative ABC transport system permease protein